MKRLYKEVQFFQKDKSYFITLDDKKIRTPSRQMLKLPTRSLAQAVADEWRDQIEEIRPAKMPLTQLANTAIDQTRPHRTTVIEQVAAYARTDLLCYRAAMPPVLSELLGSLLIASSCQFSINNHSIITPSAIITTKRDLFN